MPNLRLAPVVRSRIVSPEPHVASRAVPVATIWLPSSRHDHDHDHDLDHVATRSPYLPRLHRGAAAGGSVCHYSSSSSRPSLCAVARRRPWPSSVVVLLQHQQHQQIRGKKTKTVVTLNDLPQGAIHAEPLPAEEAAPAYPTVVLQARRNMQKFDNCVLLTRVGGFYELYFEHAEEYGPLLNLKVAQKKTSAGPVPMVVPISSLPIPLPRLAHRTFLVYGGTRF